MYRDPSEFRERFKAYKDGKSVREIYGLPGYVGGKSSSAVDDTADFLRQYEGFKEKTYLDGKGIPTIGYGFTDAKFVNKGRITRAEAEVELKRQIAVRQAELRRKLGPQVWDSLSNDSKKALTSYHFNYPAGFKDNTKFMQYWRAGRYADAIKEVDAGWNDAANPGLRTRRIAEQKLLRSDPALFSRPIPEKQADAIIQRPDVLRVAATIPQEKTIPIIDPRNATIAEAERAMWAHTAFENMPKVSDMPIWESPSLPALTPVEYDVTSLKAYSKGKVAEENEPVITQGRAGSRLDKLDRMMDPDADDNTATRVAKKIGKGFTSMAQDAKTMLGLETADRFATHTQRPEDYVDALFLAAGTMMIPRMIKAQRLPMMKDFVKHFDDMDARELGKYFFQEHPELMTQPQEAWYGELAKKSDDYFRQAIHRRAKMFEKEGRSVGPESIATKVAPDIKIAPITGSKYGGVYSPADNTMLINSDRVKDPRTALRVFNHEKAHSMQTAFEDAVGLPYPATYGAEMEQLFRYSPEYRAAHPDVHLGLETDASLHEGKSLRAYDTEQLGKLLDIDFKNMTDDEFYSYMNNGYFKDLMKNIPAGAQAQKKFVGKLKNGKLPGYSNGKIRIKPANRGKFNATKKRTGKTTEELTHSKNPLTRKRAIFAQNARKWHHADGKLPSYEDGRPRITTGGAGVTSVYQPAPNSPEVQPTVDLLERIANFLPYVGTIQDWEQVVNGNIGKVPSAVIGTVADVFLPGLRSSYKAAKAYEAASKVAPKLVDKIKYYKASQKAYKKTAANVGYQVAGTYEDILDDQGYQFPLFINK